MVIIMHCKNCNSILDDYEVNICNSCLNEDIELSITFSDEDIECLKKCQKLCKSYLLDEENSGILEHILALIEEKQ